MADEEPNTEYPINVAVTGSNDHITSDQPNGVPGTVYVNQDFLVTYYNGGDGDVGYEGYTPRMYTNFLVDDIMPGDVDIKGHEHPVRFLICHKPTQKLSPYERLNALINLGIRRAGLHHYGLVRYTDDWQDSGGGQTGDLPLTLTRSAIIDLVFNVTEEARTSIAESLALAQAAATASANSSAIAQEAADRALLAYGSYARIMPVEPYLYDIWYDTIDYKYAYDYYSSADAGYGIGACSAVRNGSFFGRNYDWTYDYNAEFIVHTDAQDGRHAVLGTAASIKGLTDEFVRSGLESILYKLVPFQLVDGINDAGLVINMNVVPRQDLDKEHYPDVLLDRNTNKYIYPIGGLQDEKVRISIMMLPRFVLDTFSRVQEAIGWLLQNATIYFPDKLLDMGYEIHCLLADKTNTRCIEFINGAINVVDINYITNFHVSGVRFNTSGKLVYTPIDASAETNPKYPTIENGIEKYGSGLERINIIDDGYADANTLQGMKSLMESIYYSRAYSGNNWEEEGPTELTRWYTEFVEIPIAKGSDILTTVDTNTADYAYALSVVDDRFIHRDRAVPGAWLTTHSVVYDIANLKSYIAVQEADKTVVTYHLRELKYDTDKQDVLSSLNAGNNVAIRDKGEAYDHKPEIVAAGFGGVLDSSLTIGNGDEGQRAACLLSVGNPLAAGLLSVKIPGSSLFSNLATFDIIGGRTVEGMVNDLNHDVHCAAFQAIATASVYPGGFIKITLKQAGELGNDYVYKAGPPPTLEELVQFPCFGDGVVQQGSLIPGRNGSAPGYASCKLSNVQPLKAGSIKDSAGNVLIELHSSPAPYSADTALSGDLNKAGSFRYTDVAGTTAEYSIFENNLDRAAFIRLELEDSASYGGQSDTFVFMSADGVTEVRVDIPDNPTRTALQLVDLLNSLSPSEFGRFFEAYNQDGVVVISTLRTGFDTNLWMFWSSGGLLLKKQKQFFQGGTSINTRDKAAIELVLSFVFTSGAAEAERLNFEIDVINNVLHVETSDTGIKPTPPVLQVSGLFFVLDLTIIMSGAADSGRTARDIVDYINNTPLVVQNLRATAEYINISSFRLKAEHPGSLYNGIVYYRYGCFGSGTILLGSEVKGYDAQSPTNYDLTVNGTNVLLDTTPEHIALIDHTVLKHNRVYDLARDVTTEGGEDWTVQPGATAEIWLDSTSAKRNIVWPSSWKWTGDGIFRPNHTQADQPDPQQNTVTVITVRNHGGVVLANVLYIIDYSNSVNE